MRAFVHAGWICGECGLHMEVVLGRGGGLKGARILHPMGDGCSQSGAFFDYPSIDLKPESGKPAKRGRRPDSEKRRWVLQEVVERNRPLREVAEELGVTPSAVSSMVTRALKAEEEARKCRPPSLPGSPA